MKKYLLSLTLSLLFIPIVLWGQNTSAKSLSSRLDTLIKYQLPAGSNVGISVYDLTTGKSLYTYQSDKLSRPASTMKLLTTITALARPDADEPFKTEVWYQGVIERDTLKGDIYVAHFFCIAGNCHWFSLPVCYFIAITWSKFIKSFCIH